MVNGLLSAPAAFAERRTVAGRSSVRIRVREKCKAKSSHKGAFRFFFRWPRNKTPVSCWSGARMTRQAIAMKAHEAANDRPNVSPPEGSTDTLLKEELLSRRVCRSGECGTRNFWTARKKSWKQAELARRKHKRRAGRRVME